MHAEDLGCDNGGNRDGVEDVDKCLPDLDVATTLAFVIEAVDARNVRTLVVAAEEEKVLWVAQLVAKEEEEGLERLLAAVHVIAEEQVVTVGREAAHLEQTDQVGVLAVDVAYYFDWRC